MPEHLTIFTDYEKTQIIKKIVHQENIKGHKIKQDEITLWEKAKKETGIAPIMSHDNYLINLGSSNKLILQKSKKAFKEEIERCHLLKIDYLNFHPGSAKGTTKEKCLDTIIESILEFAPLLKKGPTRLILETTAGQGSVVGDDFKHLSYIVTHVHKKIPIGICIDTCHTFAAGYDIRTKKGWLKTLKEFDDVVGLKHLYAFHVNDSAKDLGSKVDRHASIGKGKIGLECFKFLMTHPKVKYLPKYLETPLGDKYWKDEIALLFAMARGEKV